MRVENEERDLPRREAIPTREREVGSEERGRQAEVPSREQALALGRYSREPSNVGRSVGKRADQPRSKRGPRGLSMGGARIRVDQAWSVPHVLAHAGDGIQPLQQPFHPSYVEFVKRTRSSRRRWREGWLSCQAPQGALLDASSLPPAIAPETEPRGRFRNNGVDQNYQLMQGCSVAVTQACGTSPISGEMHMRSMRRAITLASILLSGVSVAGTKADFQVTYNSASHSVSGSLAAIRNSPDSVQYLHCDILASVTTIQGTCYARDAGNISYSCTTTAPNLLEAIRSISESSYVYFAWDTSGACTIIGVNNGSIYAPK